MPVYFMRIGYLDGIIKIGFSLNPWRRLHSAANWLKKDVWLVGVMRRTSARVEVTTQERFEHCRIEGTSDYFYPAPDLVAFIGRYACDTECKVYRPRHVDDSRPAYLKRSLRPKKAAAPPDYDIVDWHLQHPIRARQ